MPGSVSHACLHEYADTRGACGVREGRLRCMARERGNRYEAHPRAPCPDNETRVPAYSSTRTRDTCACVFVYTHMSRVVANKYALCVLRNLCFIARTVPRMLSKTSPRASIQAARSRARPICTPRLRPLRFALSRRGGARDAFCSVPSDSRVMRADRAGVDGAAASPGRGQEREAGGGRVVGALHAGAEAAAEEKRVRMRAG
jgi:hypothetical protein